MNRRKTAHAASGPRNACEADVEPSSRRRAAEYEEPDVLSLIVEEAAALEDNLSQWWQDLVVRPLANSMEALGLVWDEEAEDEDDWQQQQQQQQQRRPLSPHSSVRHDSSSYIGQGQTSSSGGIGGGSREQRNASGGSSSGGGSAAAASSPGCMKQRGKVPLVVNSLGGVHSRHGSATHLTDLGDFTAAGAAAAAAGAGSIMSGGSGRTGHAGSSGGGSATADPLLPLAELMTPPEDDWGWGGPSKQD